MSTLYVPNSIALRKFDTIFKNNDLDFTDGHVSIRFHPRYVAMHPVGLAFYAALGDHFRNLHVETDAAISYQIPSITGHGNEL